MVLISGRAKYPQRENIMTDTVERLAAEVRRLTAPEAAELLAWITDH